MLRKNRPYLILFIAVILGWVADQFFYGHPVGVSLPLYILLLLVSLFGLGWADGVKPEWRNVWLIGPILFFGLMVFVRANGFVIFLNIALSFMLLGLLVHFYTAGRLTRLGLAGYPLTLLETLGHSLIRPAPLVSASVDVPTLRDQGRRSIFPVMRGLLLALPVLTLFSCFLASADLIFASYVRQILHFEFLPDLAEWLWRGVLILVVGWLLAGGLVYAYSRGETANDEGAWQKVTRRLGTLSFLGVVEMTILLGSVNLLFLLFVAIQFAYLFGGETNVLLEGYTYAEYARQGFFELLTVSMLTLGFILGLQRFGRRQTAGHTFIFNGLSSLMVGLVLVILTSAFQRLLLYEATFGYTQLRLYSHIFMVWLGATFAWFLITLWVRPRTFALGVFIATLGFVVTLNLINPDAFIARQNLARYHQTGKLDTAYLTSLSDDAVPVLIQEPQLFDHHLLGRRNRLTREINEQRWVSFHLGQRQAYRLLVAAQSN